ncbi:nicotinamide mononucleotide deamidase-related protein [Metallosphaera tengchongensis]
MYNAEILTIGNELLNGRTVNTNATHIASKLTLLGFTVRRITTVGDNLKDIHDAVKEILSRNPMLLVTSGGLGPTYDDMTVEGVANALNLKIELNKEAYSEILEKYRSRGLQLTEERLKMAMLPVGAIAIRNEVGIAPGVLISLPGTDILLTPGVPREMESILEKYLKEYLRFKPDIYYYEEFFTVKGVMESELAPFIKRLVKETNIYIKTHPKGHETLSPSLEIQVSANGKTKDEAVYKVKSAIEEIKNKVKSMGGVVV